MSEQEQRAAVVAEARTWLGTRWIHEARVRGAGVDCGKLLAAVYEACGIIGSVTIESYPRAWAHHRGEEKFLGYVEQMAARVTDREPLPGDIVLFRYGRSLSHAGIVVEWPVIVHAYADVGQVTLDNVDHRFDLRARYAGAWDPWARRGDK
jgi:cell wall-associated NlpC family hydrolase